MEGEEIIECYRVNVIRDLLNNILCEYGFNISILPQMQEEEKRESKSHRSHNVAVEQVQIDKYFEIADERALNMTEVQLRNEIKE